MSDEKTTAEELLRLAAETAAVRATHCRKQARRYSRWWHFGMWKWECQEWRRMAGEWDEVARAANHG